MALSIASRCVILTFNFLLMVSSERVKEKIYEDISGTFCFRRLNGTNEFGCTSSISGNTGVLHILSIKSDLEWLLKEAQATPYMVMVPFNFPEVTEVLVQLKDSGKVSGIILTSNCSSFSPDDICPNRYSGLSNNQCDKFKPWNSIGSSLLFHNFDFPVMYIDAMEYQKDIDFLKECFQKHNAHDMDNQVSRSLCAVEIKSNMLAAVDSKTCIRRSKIINNLTPIRFCDPLLGLNIHMPLFLRKANDERTKQEKSTILVVTRLDGTSMFDGAVPGAGSPILGIVSLLTVAHILSKMAKNKSPPERNVMFIFFHGESYDYIGSSRMIYDMENDAFPYRLRSDVKEQNSLFKLKDIGLIVELDEITKKKIFYHSMNSIPDNNEMVSDFIRAFKKECNSLSIRLSGSVGRLPPSSLQRFLRKDPTINGVVLSSYNSSFDNMFYHSIFDTSENLHYTYMNNSIPEEDNLQKLIATSSLAIAKSLYTTLFNNSDYSFENSEDDVVNLVDELMYCYLKSPSCKIFEKATFRKPLGDKPYPVYIGVLHTNNVTTLTALTLAWLTGTRIPSRNRSECHNLDSDLTRQYYWMIDDDDEGICVETYMNYSEALSPAFEIDDYDWTSHEYSTWTESLWKDSNTARIFIQPSKKQEILTLSVGLFVLVFSSIIVYFINAKSELLFNQQVLESESC